MYPEYWLTPGVVSHMPEFLTNVILEFMAACSKTFGEAGPAIAEAAIKAPTENLSVHCIFKDMEVVKFNGPFSVWTSIEREWYVER